MSTEKTAIVDFLATLTAPVRPGDIAAATGLDKDLVSKQLKLLQQEGLAHQPKRCFWAGGQG